MPKPKSGYEIVGLVKTSVAVVALILLVKLVPSTKPAVSGKQLAAAATDDGIQLRFLAMGGVVPSDPDSFQRSLRMAGSGAVLLVGAIETVVGQAGTAA